MARIGDDQATIAMKCEAGRPAVVLEDQLPLAARADAEYAAERRIDDPQIAAAVEARPLYIAVHIKALQIGLDPGVAAAGIVEMAGQFERGFGGKREWGGKHGGNRTILKMRRL